MEGCNGPPQTCLTTFILLLMSFKIPSVFSVDCVAMCSDCAYTVARFSSYSFTERRDASLFFREDSMLTRIWMMRSARSRILLASSLEIQTIPLTHRRLRTVHVAEAIPLALEFRICSLRRSNDAA